MATFFFHRGSQMPDDSLTNGTWKAVRKYRISWIVLSLTCVSLVAFLLGFFLHGTVYQSMYQDVQQSANQEVREFIEDIERYQSDIDRALQAAREARIEAKSVLSELQVARAETDSLSNFLETDHFIEEVSNNLISRAEISDAIKLQTEISKSDVEARISKIERHHFDVTKASVEFAYWDTGDGDRRLIRQDQGICFLIGVAGDTVNNNGVYIYVEDGYWFLTGDGRDEWAHAGVACISWVDR